MSAAWYWVRDLSFALSTLHQQLATALNTTACAFTHDLGHLRTNNGRTRCVRQVRQQLTGGAGPGSKDRSSPYGTPKAMRSPMASPLISDPKAMAALDLNPGTTRVVRRAACSAYLL